MIRRFIFDTFYSKKNQFTNTSYSISIKKTGVEITI